MVNSSRFPDMAGLVHYGHSRGVSLGWYHNCCGCAAEKSLSEPHYEQDAQTAALLGFDGIKVDGCGNEPNSGCACGTASLSSLPPLPSHARLRSLGVGCGHE